MFLGVLEIIIGLVLVRLAHKSSSNFFFLAQKVRARNFYVFGGKVSERPGARAGAYYRNRKQEAKNFEEV